MTINMSQFFQVFFEETEELLAEMEKLLLAVDVSNPDPEDLNAIFRAAHSIKGGASTFGITDLGEVTHVLETLLDRIRKGETRLTTDHVEAFLGAKDILKMQLDGHRLGTVVDPDAVGDIRMLLQSLSEVHVPMPVEVAPSVPVIAPDQGMYAHRFHIELPVVSARDADALASELGLLGMIVRSQLPDQRAIFELATNESVDDIIALCSFVLDPDALKITLLPAPASASDAALGYGFFEPIDSRFGNLIPGADRTLEQQEAQQGYGFFAPFVPQGKTDTPAEVVIEHDAVPVAVTDLHFDALAGHVTGESDKRAHQRRENERTASAEASSIRVSIEKVDQLINLVGELVITQAMIEQRTDTLDPMKHERLLDSVSQLTRNTRDLQEAVMSIRMMQMDYVFSRFPRMVRDLAGKLGKKVDFVTVGAATELDKGLIERIVDPLTHLVRNSIDHGIETPAIRRAGGKSETGRLSLSAGHQGGNIVIEVSDDGGGLNRERILQKAAENGLAVSDEMTDPEVWQLIFAPGFSTADIVTDVSGRGVGMDVVKRNITAMGGVVDIRSAKGFGTTISIALPLTLAILDGMSIRVGDEVYILPLGYVVESLQPRPVDVKEISGQGQVIKVRGEYLPLIPLHQMFGIEPRFTKPSEGIVVILESEGRKAGLFVDDLVGQQQVVVKNLESNYRKVAGISGATILGDGGVSLIVDVAALLRSSRQNIDESIFS
jgi:two-component system chemotaxis sensor kinase CheA